MSKVEAAVLQFLAETEPLSCLHVTLSSSADISASLHSAQAYGSQHVHTGRIDIQEMDTPSLPTRVLSTDINFEAST